MHQARKRSAKTANAVGNGSLRVTQGRYLVLKILWKGKAWVDDHKIVVMQFASQHGS